MLKGDLPLSYHKGYHTVHDNFFTEEECNEIAKIVLRNEKEVLKIHNPNIKENKDPSGYSGLTAQHTVYNWLYHPEIKAFNIENRIWNLPQFDTKTELFASCWFNVLRHGERLHIHEHFDPEEHHKEETKDMISENFYACSVFLQGEEPSYTWFNSCETDFEYKPLRNVKGQLQVVGSMVTHEVKLNKSPQPRVSMAMDIAWDWDIESTHLNDCNPRIPGNVKRYKHLIRHK